MKSPSPARDLAVEAMSAPPSLRGRGEAGIPIAEAGPEGVALRERILSEVDGHASGKGFPCGRERDVLKVDAVDVLLLPAELVGSGLNGLNDGVARPDGFLMPARGQIDFVDGVQRGDGVLKAPGIFGEVSGELL